MKKRRESLLGIINRTVERHKSDDQPGVREVRITGSSTERWIVFAGEVYTEREFLARLRVS